MDRRSHTHRPGPDRFYPAARLPFVIALVVAIAVALFIR